MVKKAVVLLCSLISSLLLCLCLLLLSPCFTTANNEVETLMRVKGKQLDVSWEELHEHTHLNKEICLTLPKTC